MTIADSKPYIPAAGHHSLLPVYDILTKVMGVDRVRALLLEQADIRPSYCVLDVGCGTGSLAVSTKRREPSAQVFGVDPDAEALLRARRKAERASVDVQFDEGFADALPYPDATFDRVLSSMMFHHLHRDQKAGMLRELRRVLRPGGRVEMLDFAKPDTGGGAVTRILHSHQLLNDNSEARVLGSFAEAGFASVRPVARGRILIWNVAFFQAVREQ
jgi:ubiquinone/menaquinone biosynthesis C-methylase UbiE